MRRIFLVVSLFFSFIFANDLNISQTIARQNQMLLSYQKKPDRVYVNQVFKIKLKAIVAINDFDNISTKFENFSDIKVLNPNNSWKWYNDNIYFIDYYFKITSVDAKLPDIVVNISKNDHLVASSTLQSFQPEVIKLRGGDDFSGVIADDLKVLKYKTKQFDKKSNILVMQIEAKNANLRDFNVKNCIKNGIDSYSLNLPNAKIYYFAILPNTQDEFNFSYFDLSKSRFKKISIPLEVSNDDTSTQLELNPKDSKISLYKNIVLVVIAFISLIIFFLRRKFVYILIFVLIIIYLFVFYNPFNSIVIPKKTKIRILPTYNSTIFCITDRKMLVQKLNSTDKYIKVLLPDNKIGWIEKGVER